MTQLYMWGTSLPPSALYPFIFAWLFIETTGFPISDEPLLLLAGYLTTLHRLDLPAVICLALVGKVAASAFAYWVGRRISLAQMARPQTASRGLFDIFRPSHATIQSVEALFHRRGVWGVFAGRLIPVVRSFISYPAGAARMPLGVFLAATTAGSFLWIAIWTAAGALAGRSYMVVAARWNSLSWLLLVFLGAIIGLIWLWRRGRKALF